MMAFLEIIATDLSAPVDRRMEVPVCIEVDQIETFGRAGTGLGTIFTFRNGKSIETTAPFGKVKDYLKTHGHSIINMTNRPDGG
jgi:hypothetical protein